MPRLGYFFEVVFPRFVPIFVFLIVAVVVYRALLQAYRTPLRDIPGPVLARFTRLWQLHAINTRSFQKININLHRKHGPILQIGPNEYSIDDPEAAEIIYRSRDQLVKAPRYSGWGLPGLGQNLFAARDIQRHAERRRETASLYQWNTLINFENQVDGTTAIFLERMSQFSVTGEEIEMNEWFHYYALDAIGSIALGKAFGLLTKGGDVSGIMSAIHAFSKYGALVGVYHEWHAFAFSLVQMSVPSGVHGLAYIAQFINQALADQGSKGDSSNQSNFLSILYAKHQEDPKGFTFEDIHFHIVPSIGGGSDTTAITLSAAIYYLCKYPAAQKKLHYELDERKGKFSSPITFKEAQECMYLQAVIKETLRLHPGNGLPMPRVIPKGGLTLSGRFFPEGTIVGVNSWVAYANQDVFGADANEFRPERWLVSQEANNQMEQYFYSFGRGPRTCLGKNISLMELSKLIPEFVLRFDIKLVHPDREWTILNDWFMRQKDFQVRVSERKN